jgi:hypothetical protein
MSLKFMKFQMMRNNKTITCATFKIIVIRNLFYKRLLGEGMQAYPCKNDKQCQNPNYAITVFFQNRVKDMLLLAKIAIKECAIAYLCRKIGIWTAELKNLRDYWT